MPNSGVFLSLIFVLVLQTAAFGAFLFFFYAKRRQLEALGAEIAGVKRALEEKARAAHEEKNRIIAVLESMAEGVMAVDTHHKVVLVNSILGRTLGVKKEDAAGRYFWEVFRDPVINEMIEKALSERVCVRKEHSLLLSDFIFEIQVSPVFGGENFLGAVAVFHDVTRLKKLEKMRSEFVANVSHELKTPLTSILGFVETLKGGAIDDARNRLKFLTIIEEHSRKLCDLIEDLLSLSREESRGETPRREPVDLEKMLERVFRLFDKPLRGKKIQAHFEALSKPFLISADPQSLEQALSNLVDNAIKYNEPGGRILVRAYRENEAAKIEVSDTGIGIPETDLPRVFERFYRVDKSRSRESGGTGLGLSIVKHIIENHDGQVQAKNNSPKGATFTITLP